MEKNNVLVIINDNIEKKKESTKNKKYKIKFSAIIEELRQNCDKPDKVDNVEFITNILLISSKISITDKISCLTVLSYINYERRNSLYTYYLNKKIFKYLQIQKSIESFIYIRTLYRAAFFLEKEKNYFYAKKFVSEAYNLSKNSKIDNTSKGLLIEINKTIDEDIKQEIKLYIRKFTDVENPANLTNEKYNKLLNLFKEIYDNTYATNRLNKYNNIDINKDEDEDIYLYIINKNWFIKAIKFLSDYQNQRNKGLNSDFISKAFGLNYCYKNYFDIKDEKSKDNLNYSAFPGKIDNYSLINWTDNLYDPFNEDENFILKKNLVEGKDYFLLEKDDFYFLENFFGITNIIKRKKNCGDFVELKALILDEKLIDKEYNFLLRKRHFQITKNYKIIDLKQKILRCINYNINNEKYIKDNILFKDKDNIDDNNKMDIDKDDNNDNNIIKNNIEDINNYVINFYLLEKDKKDILIEICISISNNIKYKNAYLENIPIITENDFVLNLFSKYNINKNILIIELHKKNSNQLINNIYPINNLYNCTLCKKSIKSLNDKYKCNICNYSLFCSENCANNDMTHLKLDEIYLTKYLYEQFELSSFLNINIKDLKIFQPQNVKGKIGLQNLGNTCYINSTLQCLSNTLDLTKYFLLEYFRNDINTGNKLGSNGVIAFKYYSLIKKMWIGNESRINPSGFVDSIKKIKTQFAGYKQQDAQEFLSVLLDQLHEDLNRITEKPYVELLEKQNDENDLIASKRWWDLHKQREDSIIVDLFNGQFKSETICQVCNKSSITYDPFISLCVPLIKPKKILKCKIFCNTICKYLNFEYNEDSTILDLKNSAFQLISQLKKDSLFDLETVILDNNKNIIEISNENDSKYNANTKLKNILINNEIIFFYKENFRKDENVINFYIYLIEHQKPEKNFYLYNNQKNTQIKYITYPLFFQMRKDNTVNDLYISVFNRIKQQNFFIKEKFDIFLNNKSKNRILELNIIHGKNTKKDGFISYFFWQDNNNCKFCGQSNDDNLYCSILNLGAKNKTLEQNFSNFKKPIILVATSECYNLSGINTLYSDCPLFNSNVIGHNLVDEFILDKINLKDCLHSFISNENYQDDDSWFCSNCKKLQKSKQKLQIYKPPIYLIILLKRYGVKKNFNNFYGEKNNAFVSYPIYNFDIKEYIEGPEKDKAIYDLYGVIEHYGTVNQGHYTAICKNDDKWICYNDSNIQAINDPVSKKAYILFYKMQNYQ